MYATRPAPRAFTLLELLIVLAVLSGVAALAWPTVRGLLAKSEVLGAARRLRAALARARLDAIESARPWQFRYLPGSGRYEIGPLLGEESGGPADDAAPAAVRPPDPSTPTELPAAVRFDLPGADALPLSLEGPAASWDEESWSKPIVFLPSGRTSNSSVRLVGRQGYVVELTLRGVTGTVVIGRPRVQQEESP